MKHIFIIFQQSNGMGHLTRCSALAIALSKAYKVTLISGGKPVDGYTPPQGVEWVQIPAIFWPTTKHPPIPLDEGLSINEVKALRSSVLLALYKRIKPDIIITEFYPFAPGRFCGLFEELFQTIEQPKRPMMICSIRAFPNFPFFESLAPPESVNLELAKYYDFVLHHADPNIVPISSLNCHIQKCLANIPVFQTGFVRRPIDLTSLPHPRQKLLLTVGGGGGSQGLEFIKLVISALNSVHLSNYSLDVDVICGPLMSQSDRQRVHLLRNHHIHTHDHLPSLDNLMTNAKAIICMGGYNTLIEALSLNKPILAFSGSHGPDQEAQIMAFKEHGSLLSGNLNQSIEDIASLIRDLLQFKPRQSIRFDGAQKSADIIANYHLTHRNHSPRE